MVNGIGHIQCSKTKECNNIKCLFKLRDSFGLQVLCVNSIEQKMNNKFILKELNITEDDVFLPKVYAYIGTNVISVGCEDGYI
jgi:hypothetical protein